MVTETYFTLGFAAGLLGFAHCVGMCGGIAAALSMSVPGRGGWLFLAFYQVGRITTYTLLGWGGAALGATLLFTPWFSSGAKGLLVFSDLFVIGLGLVGLGWLPWLRLPWMGSANLSATLSSVVKRSRRYPVPIAGTVIGLALGLLPCGLLYPVLLGAVQTAEPSRGALTMLGFGLGTAPSLLVMGTAANRYRAFSGRFFKLAWIAVILMGGFNLYRHLSAWFTPSCCG